MDTDLKKMDGRKPDISVSAILIVFLLVVAGTTVHWGTFKWRALLLMLCAVGVCVWAHWRPRSLRVPVEGLLIALVVAFLATIIHTNIGQNEIFEQYFVPGVNRPWKQVNIFGRCARFLSALAMLAALTYALRGWKQNRKWARLRFVVLVLIAVSLRPLMLKSAPIPRIDVYVSQTLAAKGLLLQLAPEAERKDLLAAYTRENDLNLAKEAYQRSDGSVEKYQAWVLRNSRNVYEMQFPQPHWAAPRLDAAGNIVKDAWIDHYGYPPETVYANALSWWAFKDVRALWAVCDLLGALFIFALARRMNPGAAGRRFCELLTLAFLFLPRSLFVLEQSWTEPLCVATMGGLALLLAKRTHSAWRGILMGLFFSSKQYVVLAALPLLKLKKCRPTAWVVGVAVGVLLIVPFALWNWDALFHDVLGFFLKSEHRPEALSIAGALKRHGHEISAWVVTPLWLAGLGFFTWKMKQTLTGMLFATTSCWLFFFLLGKQAFMNYWYLIMYGLLLAAAAGQVEQPCCNPEQFPGNTCTSGEKGNHE